ncbi:MAG TPA: hypothetical protein ENH23_02760 [candidate division Zixibacteria bacterium]|nr:hypothetical protein [candidate division Zixibacteria bacterium]
MKLCLSTETDAINHWHSSGQAARICGLDLNPITHPLLSNSVQCVIKGQASVFFLKQVPQGNIWLLKKFAPSRRPTDDYLQAVTDYLPGGVEFFTCSQRRLLTSNHLDIRNSGYKNSNLIDFLEGTILMPKVHGTTWASIADDLREEKVTLYFNDRLQIALNLAECISLLEAGQCSHRDLSSTNVFVGNKGEVYLIDWDCLYHPKLSFQSNTTIGTMGYIAPFLKDINGQFDAAASWCNYSDRFALSVLIAEILLIDSRTPKPKEDGTLFSQSQIDSRVSIFVEEQIEILEDFSPQCANLFTQAFFASTFQDCPSPDDWISILKHTLRISSQRYPQHDHHYKVNCDSCRTTFPISKTKHLLLKQKGKSVLCKKCFEVQLCYWSSEKVQQNLTYPQVCCEHCSKHFRLQREKLDKLRNQAKPILCQPCLAGQMRLWKNESIVYEQNHPRVACTRCFKSFRISRDKLNILSSKGKSLLCKSCFKIKINSDWRL